MSELHKHHHNSMLLPIPDDFHDWNQVGQYVAVLILLELVVTGLIVNVLPRGVVDKVYLNSCIIMFPKLMFLLYFSIQVVLKHMNGDWEEQIYHMKDGQPLDYYNIGQFFCIFIAHSLCAIIVELYKDGFGWATFTMLLHHVITVASYVGCMLTGRFAYLCCLSSLCEITNFPLSLLYITKTKGGGVKEWVEKKLGFLLTVNGAILWITFVLFRLILFPYVNYKVYDLWTKLKAEDTERWNQVYWAELIGLPGTITVLFVMSSFWFYKIHTGIMKIINGMKPSDAAPDKAE